MGYGNKDRAPIIIQGGTDPQLRQDVDTVKLDLARKVSQEDSSILNFRNAESPLSIYTYDKSDQPIHPSVIKFATAWNGYKYWMAYTPFPNGQEFHENPCLAVSNDLLTWKTPSGLINPLNAIPAGDIGKYHNSDTHIVYRNDLNRIEVWWRRRNRNPDGEVIYRVTSTDGVTFTPLETMYTYIGDAGSFLSPVVMWDNTNTKYQIWVFSDTAGTVKYYETPDGFNWSLVRNIPTITTTQHNGLTWRLWHFDIQKTDNGYEFVGNMRYGTYPNHIGHIFYSKSTDNIVYEQPKILLERGKLGNFDSNELYRACLLKENGKYYLFYSANSTDGTWNTGLSISRVNNDIFSIVGAGKDYKNNIPRAIKSVEGLKVGSYTEYGETFLKLVDPNKAEARIGLSPDGANLVEFKGSGGGVSEIRTSVVRLSKGTTAGSPIPYSDGDLRHNPTTGFLQMYYKNLWRDIPVILSGGNFATFDFTTIGAYYWNTDKRRPIFYSHGRMQDPFEECGHSATTSGRPIATNYQVGKVLFDTTLGKPIWLKTIGGGHYSTNSRVNNQAVTLGYKILLNGNIFEVTTAGTTASVAPTFDTTSGSTTTDGTAVWTCRGIPAVWVDATGTTV